MARQVTDSNLAGLMARRSTQIAGEILKLTGGALPVAIKLVIAAGIQAARRPKEVRGSAKLPAWLDKCLARREQKSTGSPLSLAGRRCHIQAARVYFFTT